ncbi:MAPEG family protein [Lacimicrobium sp. SS2-24]|uniref:MAPEG family protein n=1 Tax=Lacimicrobium sp. SS2-24 TaxID=2005569 RepID=UPI000B4B3DF3|nr:MAPEG family protein [Lacimicrobium sp. SS2-24]
MYSILLCLFIATVLPILAKAPLAIAQAKTGRYDNRLPRQQQASLTGFGARARAGHENAFEALLMFMPGAIMVMVMELFSAYTIGLAVTFVVARVLYHAFYLLDWDKLRSLVWLVAFACSILLLWEALIKAL